jgi:hypothetical protein
VNIFLVIFLNLPLFLDTMKMILYRTQQSFFVLFSFIALLLFSSSSSTFSGLTSLTIDKAAYGSTEVEVGPEARIDRCTAPQRPQTLDPRPQELIFAECRIDQKYEQLNGNGLNLGQPTIDVTASQREGGVYYRDYERQFVTASGQRGSDKGSIYFIPDRGTFEIHGDIWQKFNEMGRENNFLGFPKEDTRVLPENRGLVQVFDGGVIYWSEDTGAHELHNGPILNTYASLGWEAGPLGFPITDESPALRDGKYNHFKNGAIYWAPELDNAYAVYGPIYEKWKSMRWEHSELGFPISNTGRPPFAPVDSSGIDPVSDSEQYSRFQNGAISWSALTEQTYVYLNPFKFAITFDYLHVYESHDDIGCAEWWFYARVNEYFYTLLDDFCVDADNTYAFDLPLVVVTVPRDGRLHITTEGCDRPGTLWIPFPISGGFECDEHTGVIDIAFTSNDNWGLNINPGYGRHQIESDLGDGYTDYWIDFSIWNCEVVTSEICNLAPGKYFGLRLPEGVRYYPGEPDRSELQGCTFC